MNGIGSAWGAITFVNALPTGVGSAAAVSLPVEVEVDVTDARGQTPIAEIPLAHDTPLVRRSLVDALKRFRAETPSDVNIHIRSAIPAGRGLKSSSAVSVAIVRAIAGATGHRITPSDAARFSSEVSRGIGLSATGAFDDAYASASGGIVVTDNTTHRLLRHDEASPEWKVVLWVPERVHTPSTGWLGAFQKWAGEGRAAALAAQSGRYLVALDRNTQLVERVMGYDYRSMREVLRKQGALGSGVSGMGPTLASIVPANRSGAVQSALPAGPATVLLVDLIGPGPGAIDRGNP